MWPRRRTGGVAVTYRDDLSAMDRAEAAEKECERLRTELARKPRPEWHFVVGAFGVLLVGMVAMILWLKLYIDREIKACPCLEKDAAQPIPARTYRWTCPASEGALVPPGETAPPPKPGRYTFLPGAHRLSVGHGKDLPGIAPLLDLRDWAISMDDGKTWQAQRPRRLRVDHEVDFEIVPVRQEKPEALPATCSVCEHCDTDGMIAWCLRDNPGVSLVLLSYQQGQVPEPPTLKTVAQLAEPPSWCPLREASEEKEHAE